ncbi:hypothetical protein OF897_07870 [Chryseobacterium formosus]|uniref:Uncharacterized protein n=1 Tax=Chryseobacterium formosus TaxID=1537363 RepID=A0ABT3XTM5_9FLAO|nr:hypothetical protein [Chryseobacterium formosus]MCX8523839.1 hypothetical protein [Chryseobacterium formosus]
MNSNIHHQFTGYFRYDQRKSSTYEKLFNPRGIKNIYDLSVS